MAKMLKTSAKCKLLLLKIDKINARHNRSYKIFSYKPFANKINNSIIERFSTYQQFADLLPYYNWSPMCPAHVL